MSFNFFTSLKPLNFFDGSFLLVFFATKFYFLFKLVLDAKKFVFVSLLVFTFFFLKFFY